jgi:hypothetical protein
MCNVTEILILVTYQNIAMCGNRNSVRTVVTACFCLPWNAFIRAYSVVSEMPLCPLARAFIRSASNVRVFSGFNGVPTPAAWDLMRLYCSSLLRNKSHCNPPKSRYIYIFSLVGTGVIKCPDLIQDIGSYILILQKLNFHYFQDIQKMFYTELFLKKRF